MNKFFSLLFILISGFVFSQDVTDFLGIPELTFNENKYVLNSSNQKSKIQYVQNYILQDERIEDASNVISIYYFVKDIDAKEATMHKTDELENRKSTDKFCNYNVTQNPNATEFLVDFFTSNVPKSKDEPAPETEQADYNVYRFKNVMIGDKLTFLIIAYKEKSTGDIKDFTKSIGRKRNKILEGIITMTVPAINLKTN